MPVLNRRLVASSAVLFLSLCVGVQFAAARGGGGHGGGGGHAGGYARGYGGGHGGENRGGAGHYGREYYGDRHNGYYGNNYRNRWGGWGGGWGGWAGGIGLGAAGAYAYDQPFSVPLDTYANDDSYDQYDEPNNDYASNDSPNDGDETDSTGASGGDGSVKISGSDQPQDIDHRAAIQLVLPNKDAHVFLNGKLVPGEGTRRLVMTPELDDDNPSVKSYPFHVLAVWEENGRPVQREGEINLAPGGGAVLNLAVAPIVPSTTAKPATAAKTPAPAPASAAAAKTVVSDK